MSNNKSSRSFRHLNWRDRDRIEALLNNEIKPSEIAKILKIHKSTVSREVSKRKLRNDTYDATKAELKASVKRSNSKHQGMKIEANPELKNHIIRELKKKHSPDEISGRLKQEKSHLQISTKSIYHWLFSPYGEKYTKYLCTRRRKVKRHKNTSKREMIQNAVSIHERPDNPNLIHAQTDTFVSSKTHKRGVLNVIEGINLLSGTFMPFVSEKSMTEAVNQITKDKHINTNTFDRGIENRYHELFNIPCYFCDPHSPWQKPHVENNIGLLRRWFIPKKTNLDDISEDQLQACLHILNGKFRKSLGYKSAYEVALERGVITSIPVIDTSCLDDWEA